MLLNSSKTRADFQVAFATDGGPTQLPPPFACPITSAPLCLRIDARGRFVMVAGHDHHYRSSDEGFLNFTRESLVGEVEQLWPEGGRESFRGNGGAQRPERLADRYDQLMLRLAKAGRRRPAQNQEFYNQFFGEKDILLFARDYRNILRRHELLRSIPRTGALRVIDLGCGTGHALRPLASRGWDLYGMEYAPKALRLCARHVPEATLFAGDMTRLPLAQNWFDVAISLEVCEHIRHDVTAMQEAHRILKPGGRFIMSVPGNRHHATYEELIGHYRHYTQEQLVQILTSVGFKTVMPLRHYPHFHRRYFVWWPWLSLADRVLRRVGGRSLYTLGQPEGAVYRTIIRHLTSAISQDRRRTGLGLRHSTFVCAFK